MLMMIILLSSVLLTSSRFFCCRSEWGYSHAMADLGLVPVSHHHPLIETDDGCLEIVFRWMKHPVCFDVQCSRF